MGMADNNDKNGDAHLMQVVRITIDGQTYTLFGPPMVPDDEEVGVIEDLEFGEFVLAKHVVASLMHYLNNTVH
jgi:hypothetical protein